MVSSAVVGALSKTSRSHSLLFRARSALTKRWSKVSKRRLSRKVIRNLPSGRRIVRRRKAKTERRAARNLRRKQQRARLVNAETRLTIASFRKANSATRSLNTILAASLIAQVTRSILMKRISWMTSLSCRKSQRGARFQMLPVSRSRLPHRLLLHLTSV